MIKALYRHRSGAVVSDLSEKQLLEAAGDRTCALWVDLESPSEAESKLVFEQIFRLHPLVIEDILHDVHLPKLDDYSSYLFLVFHVVTVGDERMDLHTSEIDAVLGDNFLLTVHNEARPIFEQFWAEDAHRQAGLARGPAYLLYEILDRQTDRYVPLIDRFEQRLEELGDRIFLEQGRHDNEILNDLLTAKSSALRLRRILEPQCELLKRLMRDDIAVVPAEARLYFRDVLDHLTRLLGLADSTRELAIMTIETHLALVNNRMNNVMKVLTIIATVFIPLSFLASVYGMNFEYMPELQWRIGYPLLWIVFLGIVSALYWFFRRSRWI